MKIRYFILIYTVAMLAVIMFLAVSYQKLSYTGRDMVFYNEQRRLVEEELKGGAAPDVIEKEYNCVILFCGQEEYESRLNAYMEENAVIYDYEIDGALVGKMIWRDEKKVYQTMQRTLFQSVAVVWFLILLVGYLLFGMIYIYFIRPFRQMKAFASQIAKGNLDVPLPAQRHNLFGAFTESFDLMREELGRARESEYQANCSKKELVAELSHDIKTPVSTIKATCEVLQMKEQNKDTLEKVDIIAAKADTIDHLVDNLFHATVEELEVLKVEAIEQSSLRVEKMIAELKYYGEIIMENRIPECLVYMDALRLEQVIDNVINNSYKYAATSIVVSFWELADGIRIRIADRGDGVPEEELALITEKFYRGSNTKGKSGSGLGLYLSGIFMEQMQGGLECYNENGFVVELFLKKV